MDEQRRPLTYREWLDNRFAEEAEDDDLESDVGHEEQQDEEQQPRDDGFPAHDDYSEEAFP